MQSSQTPDMISAGEYIVGTLLVRGVVKAEDAERAVKIVAEELSVWLVINEYEKLH